METAEKPAPPVPASFETSPAEYRHLRLQVDGNIARLFLSVREDAPLVPGYALKLNSYDLGVDIELFDAVQRLRFSHPEVSAVILTSDRDRVFCAGANIHMLAQSSHGFKVNFCKYTNETRLCIEDASLNSGQKYVAAVSGACAGGGYELAMACDEIILIDDGSSTVSLPEVPLLGVLPGTGGLSRLVDKRKVRRDQADVFATLAEGIRGRRAEQWRLVDRIVPRSRFHQAVEDRARSLAAKTPKSPGSRPGIVLQPLSPVCENNTVAYSFVTLQIEARRVARLTVRGPNGEQAVRSAEQLHTLAGEGKLWALQAFRELDDALCRLRFHCPEVGLVLVFARGSQHDTVAADEALWALKEDWLGREVLLNMARVLRRFDMTSKTFFAVADAESCFSGSLLELLLASDRSYVFDDPSVSFATSPLLFGALLCGNGQTRLGLRHQADASKIGQLADHRGSLTVQQADDFGFCTVVADEIDFADTLRLAVEERSSMSPDALTAMEQNLRFPGPDNLHGKVFGRLTAWQNWIFIRGNATGPQGALTCYGRPERPVFDFRRT